MIAQLSLEKGQLEEEEGDGPGGMQKERKGHRKRGVCCVAAGWVRC